MIARIRTIAVWTIRLALGAVAVAAIAFGFLIEIGVIR